MADPHVSSVDLPSSQPSGASPINPHEFLPLLEGLRKLLAISYVDATPHTTIQTHHAPTAPLSAGNGGASSSHQFSETLKPPPPAINEAPSFSEFPEAAPPCKNSRPEPSAHAIPMQITPDNDPHFSLQLPTPGIPSGASIFFPRTPLVEIDEEEYLGSLTKCSMQLLSKLSLMQGEKSYDTKALKNILDSLWQLQHPWKLIPLGKGYFCLRFTSKEDQDKIWSQGSFPLKPGVLRIMKWQRDFNPYDQKQVTARLWVRFLHLPIEYWSPKILYGLAKAVGIPLRIDQATLNLDYGYFARVLVDVDMLNPLPDHIMVQRKGHSFPVDLEFERVPSQCSHCGYLGHLIADCKLLKGKQKQSEVPSQTPQWHTQKPRWKPKTNTAKPGSSVAQTSSKGFDTFPPSSTPIQPTQSQPQSFDIFHAHALYNSPNLLAHPPPHLPSQHPQPSFPPSQHAAAQPSSPPSAPLPSANQPNLAPIAPSQATHQPSPPSLPTTITPPATLPITDPTASSHTSPQKPTITHSPPLQNSKQNTPQPTPQPTPNPTSHADQSQTAPPHAIQYPTAPSLLVYSPSAPNSGKNADLLASSSTNRELVIYEPGSPVIQQVADFASSSPSSPVLQQVVALPAPALQHASPQAPAVTKASREKFSLSASAADFTPLAPPSYKDALQRSPVTPTSNSFAALATNESIDEGCLLMRQDSPSSSLIRALDARSRDGHSSSLVQEVEARYKADRSPSESSLDNFPINLSKAQKQSLK